MSELDIKDIGFSIIKKRGDPKTATTVEGKKVNKEEYVYCEDPYWPDPETQPIVKVKCMDYHMEHFVYLDPVSVKAGQRGRWFAWCTCGSPAVIVGMEEYTLVCYYQLQFGRHVTGDGREWK